MSKKNQTTIITAIILATFLIIALAFIFTKNSGSNPADKDSSQPAVTPGSTFLSDLGFHNCRPADYILNDYLIYMEELRQRDIYTEELVLPPTDELRSQIIKTAGTETLAEICSYVSDSTSSPSFYQVLVVDAGARRRVDNLTQGYAFPGGELADPFPYPAIEAFEDGLGYIEYAGYYYVDAYARWSCGTEAPDSLQHLKELLEKDQHALQYNLPWWRFSGSTCD